MACISRFATAILSGETELALGTIRVNLAVITCFIQKGTIKENTFQIYCSEEVSNYEI